jgi:hypothetical protein
MDINVNLRLESPELMAALLALAKALPQMQIGDVLPIEKGQPVEVKESEDKTESKNEELVKEEIKKEKVKTIALEDVRAKLASLSQSGKQRAVKELITKYGAKKLTDIDSACYEKLLNEAEVL